MVGDCFQVEHVRGSRRPPSCKDLTKVRRGRCKRAILCPDIIQLMFIVVVALLESPVVVSIEVKKYEME